MKKIFSALLPMVLFAGCRQTVVENDLPEPSGVDVSQALCLASGLPGGDDNSSGARRTRRIELVRNAGVELLRWDFRWSVIERQKGSFNFKSYDNAVDEAGVAGVEWIGLLDYGNPWATSSTSSDDKYPPDDPADFATYARATVTHFKDRISRWEIWNEQNAGYRFWKPSADSAAYAELFVAAAKAIHQVDPKAKVAFGGTFYAPQGIPGSVDFFNDCYEHVPELGEYFDAVAFHPYMIYPPAVAPESDLSLPPFDYIEQRTMTEMISDIRNVMTAHGDGDKPIWITEVGWPEFESVPATMQAQYLARTNLLSLAAGVEHVCWYTLEDSTGHAISFEDTFGLVPYDPDPTDDATPEPKPAYLALQALSKILAGTRFDRDLASDTDLPVDTHLLRFATPERNMQILAIWSHGNKQHMEIRPSSPGYVFTSLFSMTGDQREPGSDNSLSVEVGPDVTYIVEEASRHKEAIRR